MDDQLKKVLTIWLLDVVENNSNKRFCFIPMVVDGKLTSVKIRLIWMKDNCSNFNVSFFDNNTGTRLNGTFKHLEFIDKTAEEIIDSLIETVNEYKTKKLCSTKKCLYPVTHENSMCNNCVIEEYYKSIKVDSECSICMEQNDVLSNTLSCHEKHTFHYECLVPLFQKNIKIHCGGCGNCTIESISIQCPNCRKTDTYAKCTYELDSVCFQYSDYTCSLSKLDKFNPKNVIFPCEPNSDDEEN